jgi:kynurenine aminotransferase
VFCTNSPLQEAAASGLEQARSRRFFENQVAEYQERRDILLSAFDRVGLKYSLPEGTYFVLVVRVVKNSPGSFSDSIASKDISKLKYPEDYPFPESVQGRGKDFKYVTYFTSIHVAHVFFRACWFIAVEIGVSSIPVSEVSQTSDARLRLPS